MTRDQAGKARPARERYDQAQAEMVASYQARLEAAERKAMDLQHERAFICQALQIDESADVIKAVCDQGDNLADCEARYERLVAELAAREAEQLT